MNFLNDLRGKIYRFMQGRYGPDALSRALLYGALPLLVLGMLPGFSLFTLLAYVALGWDLYRMLSRNFSARRMENEKFLLKFQPLRRKAGEAVNRFRNRNTYAYFSCPQCKAKLRVPKGVGQITVTCKMCGHKFDRKA